VNLARFKASDLDEIRVQAAQASELEYGRSIAGDLERNLAFTGRHADRVVAIAGVISADRDVGYLWALLAHDAGEHMKRLHRMGLRLIRCCGKARILATARTDFPQGARWLQLLGFSLLDPDLDGEALFLKVQP
jgi:hypothetical protein